MNPTEKKKSRMSLSDKLTIAVSALRKINLGRHGGMDASAMALEAWGALRKISGEE